MDLLQEEGPHLRIGALGAGVARAEGSAVAGALEEGSLQIRTDPIGLVEGLPHGFRDLAEPPVRIAAKGEQEAVCAATDSTRRAFARDLDNLTLANPRLNRNEKRNKDAADWLPVMNQCWFAWTVISVKLNTASS